MKKKDQGGEQRLYLGVDVGGTKVQASLVQESGEIVGREKCPTPRQGGPERVVAAIEKTMDDMVRKGAISADDLTAIGIAVPGVVDPDRGIVVVAPNMQLTIFKRDRPNCDPSRRTPSRPQLRGGITVTI